MRMHFFLPKSTNYMRSERDIRGIIYFLVILNGDKKIIIIKVDKFEKQLTNNALRLQEFLG
jgi:hypothetical protein